MATIPSPGVLVRVAQLSVEKDKPIYLDYYSDSVEKKCCIGIQDTNTKYLVKSDSEYTSTVAGFFKCDGCYIVETENSLYVVSADIPVKKIASSSTQESPK
jgi:hypothetical protein